MNTDRKDNNPSVLETYADYRDGIYHLRELPPVVDVSYPCVAIADIPEMVMRFAPNTPGDAALQLQHEFLQIQKDSLNSGFTFVSVDSRILNNRVTQSVLETAQSDMSLGVANMDRNICTDCVGEQFYRLNVSRGEKEGLVARPGELETPEQQLDKLAEWAKFSNFEKILLVDDVLAYGGTMTHIVRELQERLPNCEIKVLVGIAASGGKWSGIEKLREETGIDAKYLTKVIASVENDWSTGMSIPVSRDMTIFGGKVGIHESSGMQTIHPYFLPYSKPKKATLASDVNGAERSFRLLEFSKKIVSLIDINRSEKLSIGDLIDSGTGVPFTNLTSLEDKMEVPKRNMAVSDYIEYNRQILQENLETVIEEIKI